MKFVFRTICCFILVANVFVTPSHSKIDDGEKKKTSTGKSYLYSTRVERLERPSSAAKEFTAERVWSGHDDWEPAIAVDPSSSYVYQMTTRYTGKRPCDICRLPAIVFRSSSDGGTTWGPDRWIALTHESQNDPQIAVANDGTIYAVLLNDFVPGIKFTKSSDHGLTWTEPIRLTGGGRKPAKSDKPVLAISPNGQHVYIAFNFSDSWVVASHNFGRTFLTAVKTNSDTRYWFHSGGAIAPNGDVYFTAADYSQNFEGDVHIDVLKSTDKGKSWATIRIDTSKETPSCDWSDGCYLGFLGPAPGLAIDPNSKILIAYNAGNVAGGNERIYVRTSLNGVNWSARKSISAGSGTVDSGFPVVQSGGPDDFRVVWQDNRNGPPNIWNTWYRRSTNGGLSWGSPIRLSDQSSGAPYKTAGGYFFPYGDYLEFAVDQDGKNFVIWGEGSSYDGPGGTWYTRGK
jgi:hypothetical protein